MSNCFFSDLHYSVSTVGTFSTVGAVSAVSAVSRVSRVSRVGAAGAAGAVSAVSAVSIVIDLFILIYWGLNYDSSMGRGYKYCSCSWQIYSFTVQVEQTNADL